MSAAPPVPSPRTPPLVLDRLDRELIDLLVDDGRASFTSLGRRIGLSADAIRARYNRLVTNNVVRVTGIVSPFTVGLRSIGVLRIKCLGHTRAVTNELVAAREITYLSATGGDFNLIGEVTAADREELHRFVFDTVGSMPGVVDIDVLDWLHVHKWDTRSSASRPIVGGAPRSDEAREPFVLDDLDLALARLLRLDGRASYRDLAELVEAPYGVVRRRCAALLDAGVVTIVTVVDERNTFNRVVANLLVDVQGPLEPVIDALVALDEAEIVIHTAGRAPVTCEVVAVDEDSLATTLRTQVHTIPGIGRVQVQLVGSVLKLPAQWAF